MFIIVLYFSKVQINHSVLSISLTFLQSIIQSFCTTSWVDFHVSSNLGADSYVPNNQPRTKKYFLMKNAYKNFVFT